MTKKDKISLGIAVGLAATAWFLERHLTKSVSGVGSAKKFYVYAGYYELYISTKPMPAPYILQRTCRTIENAIKYAESFGDTVIFCDNVKNDLPDYIYDALEDTDYFKY